MRSKPFRFHPEARKDFRGAILWYRTRSPLVATEFRVTVSDAIRDIVKAPQRWPKYLRGTRRFVLRRFPFSIIYLDESRRPEHRSRGPQQAKARILETAALDPPSFAWHGRPVPEI